jgi:hypothetical protein
MVPDGIERLTRGRGWTVERYRELVTIQVLRTLVAQTNEARPPGATPGV